MSHRARYLGPCLRKHLPSAAGVWTTMVSAVESHLALALPKWPHRMAGPFCYKCWTPLTAFQLWAIGQQMCTVVLLVRPFSSTEVGPRPGF